MGSTSSVSSPERPHFLVIGAGSRGNAYARAVTACTPGIIAAVAEPDAFKLQAFGKKYIWHDGVPKEGQAFSDWQDFVAWEQARRAAGSSRDDVGPPITGVFICTLDETHVPIITALAPLNLHIMCEKPLALSMSDCLAVSRALQQYPAKVFSIGHVLRYSPHNMLLRDLLVTQQAIGEIVSIEHTEPVGWWHFAHSYVRGNWRRATPEGVGSLLTKSCHDVDFLLWLMCSPSALTGRTPHLPSSVTSSGNLTHFRRARKPKKAGDATNCTNCVAEPECVYSAQKIYRGRFLRGDTGWPLKIVVPDIEDVLRNHGWERAEERLMQKLRENYHADTPDEDVASRAWYGRCVYESDNNVVDDQLVVINWDADDDETGRGRGPKQAVLHMTYPTQAQCDRRGRIYGSAGEISYDSDRITVYTFHDGRTRTHKVPAQNPEALQSHGGGDWGLAGSFVRACQAVDTGKMDVARAQREIVGCDLEEAVRSHAVVFAAEDARLRREVVEYRDWSARAERLEAAAETSV